MKKSFTFLLIVLLNAIFCFSQTSNIASLNLTVTDQKGNFIKELKKDDLKLFLKDKQQEIISLEKSVNPLCVGVLFDISKSMRVQAKTELHEYRIFAQAFENFVKNSNSENEYFLATFAEKQNLILDTTKDQNKVFEALKKLSNEKLDDKNQVKTKIDESLIFGYEKLSDCKAKKILILISDGQEFSRTKSNIEKVNNLISINELLLYSVDIFSNDDYYFADLNYNVKAVANLGIAERTSQKVGQYIVVKTEGGTIPTSFLGLPEFLSNLNDLSLNTGGRLLLPMNSDEAKEAFEYLAEELKNQYVLTFKYQAETNSKRQKIRIEISGEKSKEKLIVRTRKEI